MKKSRHGSLSGQLKAVLDYRSRPESVEAVVPIKTNWSVVPANDNNPEDLADKHAERRWRIRPSIDDIREAVATGDVERNDKGQIISIGKLRFSDGDQTERAYCHGPEGKLIQYDAPMPVGAMLNTADAQERMLGGDDSDTGSNAYFKKALGGKLRTSKPVRRRNIEVRRNYTTDESKVMLAEAVANTPTMPTVEHADRALPWQPKRLTDLFIGMKKGKKGESGSIMWQDISTSIVARETWTHVEAELMVENAETLDAVSGAKTFADLGSTGHKRTRERAGKARLIAANDNLMAAMQKVAG